LLKISLYFDLH